MPLEEHGRGGVLACPACAMGVPGLTPQPSSQGTAISSPWVGHSVLQGPYKPRSDGVCLSPAMGQGLLRDGVCVSPAVGQGLL